MVRYGDYLEKRIDYLKFQDILDEILKNLIKKEKGLEINTSGIRYGLNSSHSNIDILKLYRELGDSIITIGSDAYNVKDLASDFNIACDLLTKAKFTDIAVYHNRKPEFIKLKL